MVGEVCGAPTATGYWGCGVADTKSMCVSVLGAAQAIGGREQGASVVS